MKHTVTALTLAALAGASTPALALPIASAQMDWATFSVHLHDLNPWDAISPSITFNRRESYAHADAYSITGSSWFMVHSWTTPILAADGLLTASADESGLMAMASSGPGYAYAEREGEFTLSPYTRVLFSVYSTVMAATPGSSADTWLSTWGPGASGTGRQHTSSELHISWPGSSSGMLSATFTNQTNAPMVGNLSGRASVYAPIPEPGTYALMLAGLSLVGWMVRRRA